MGNNHFENPKTMIPAIKRYFSKMPENAVIINSVLCALILEDNKLFYRELDIGEKRIFSGILSDSDKDPTLHFPTERMMKALEEMNYFK